MDLAVGAFDIDGTTNAGAVYVINLQQSHCETTSPTTLPTPIPTAIPSPNPSAIPFPVPTALPVFNPTSLPMPNPSMLPAPVPTSAPSSYPSALPMLSPTSIPVPFPTVLPQPIPSALPVPVPTLLPSLTSTCFTDGYAATDAQKISMLYGNLNSFYTIYGGDNFGWAVAALEDLNSDGVVDMAVGVPHSDDVAAGGAGAVYVLFLETNGNVKNAQKLSLSYGNLGSFYTIGVNDRLGTSLSALGDVDGDNIVDLAIGTYADDDGGLNMGAAYIVFLETNGVAKGAQKLSMLYGNFNAFYSLQASVYFGYAVGALGDADGDGALDLASGVCWADDDGGTNMGAVYVLFLDTTGSARAVQKL